jgi:hypothetical protein
MLGLDKKAVEKLRKLRELEALSEAHRAIVSSMLEKYSDPDWHFFTSAQRRLVDDIAEIYLEPPSARDMETLRAMDEAAEDENASPYERNRVLEILAKNGRAPRAFSKWDEKFVKDLLRDLRTRARQAGVRAALEVALDEGRVRPGSEEFCRSIIRQFDDRRRWSPIQMEHAEKILAGNADPE